MCSKYVFYYYTNTSINFVPLKQNSEKLIFEGLELIKFLVRICKT